MVWALRKKETKATTPNLTADALEMMDTTNPQIVMQAVVAYLQSRLGVRFVEATPNEVRDALRRRGFSKQVQEEAAAWFRQVDALRFASGSTTSVSLADAARAWITAMNADRAGAIAIQADH